MNKEELEKDAQELGIDKLLYQSWYFYNRSLFNVLKEKTRYKLSFRENVTIVNGYNIAINFINNEYLELEVKKENKVLLMLRLEKKVHIHSDDILYLSAHVLMAIEKK